MQLAPAQIDIGKLAFDFHYGSAVDNSDLTAYLNEKLNGVAGKADDQKPQDVVLYGFGRIGRLLARLLIERQEKQQASFTRYCSAWRP